MADEEGFETIDTTGAIAIAGHHMELVDLLNKSHFGDGEKKNVHQFAMSIGIALNERLERKKWEKTDDHPAGNPGSQLSTYSNIDGLLELLRIRGDLDADLTATTVMSEYLNGGLAYLERIDFVSNDDAAFERFYADFPHLKEDN